MHFKPLVQRGDLYLLCRFLMARDDKRVFNIREKQFVKFLSRELGCDLQKMITDLEKGDPGETAKNCLEEAGKAQKRSTFTLNDVNNFLDNLTKVTKEDDQQAVLSPMISKCTGGFSFFFFGKILKRLLIKIIFYFAKMISSFCGN